MELRRRRGREEIINRRVGRNELDTMQALLAVVDAQREYAATDADGNGFADYAKRFRSSPGKKDGLYWPTEGNAPQARWDRWSPSHRERVTASRRRTRRPRTASNRPITATTTAS
jgi:hypothetical protein